MDKYNIWLDGVSAESVGIKFLSSLNLSEAVPRSTEYTVPGRNGTVHIYDGAFKNRTATVDGCLYSEDLVKGDFAAVNAWLFGSLGYRRLVTDDDPAHYLMARITNGPEIAAKARKVAPFRIRFDCKPQRFLLSGDTSKNIISTLTFTNPTAFVSKPLLEIEYTASSASGTISVNGSVMRVDLLPVANFTRLFFDAETGVTYRMEDDGTVKVYDGIISGREYAEIVPGENTVSIGGDITSVKLTPRWWDL